MEKRTFNNMRKKKIVCSSVIACAILIATLAFTSMVVADDFNCEMDNDSPIVEVTYGEPNIIYEGSPGSFPMIGAGTKVTLIATDPGYPENGSGVSTLWVSTTGPSDLYPINDGDPEDESDEYGVIQVSFTFFENCWHQIDYRAVDYCDNYLPSEGGFMGEDFYVDATPPTTNTEIIGPNVPIPGTSYSWFGSCTTKWLNVTDDGCQGGAGVEQLRIKVYKSSSGVSGPWEQIGNYVIPDGGEDGEFADVSDEDGVISVPFHFDEDCWHLIEHWGVDAVGNEETVSTSQGTKQIHKVDVTHPESSLMVVDRNYCMIEDDICVTTDSTIEMVIDNVGTEPCIYPETMGFFRIYVEEEDQWYPNETGEGIYHHYGLDDVEYWKDDYWYRYDEEYKIAFSEECHHIIEFFSKDPLCNTEQTNSIHFYVDDQAPEIVKTVGTPHCGPEWEEFDEIPREDVPYFPDGAWSYCVTTDTEINITTIVYGCCESIVTIEYKIWKDGESEPKSWEPYTGNFTFEDECKHFLLVRAYDCLENGKYDSSYWDLQIFYVDDSAPLIEKTIGDPHCTIVEDEEYCVTTDTPIIIDAENNGCCPDDDITVRYRINEGDWFYLEEFPETIYFEEECTHVLTIEAWDCLGNTAIDIQTFHVDDTVPVIHKTIGDPHCTIVEDEEYCVTTDTEIIFDIFSTGCCPTDLTIQYNNGSGWNVLTEEDLPFSHYFEEECEHWLNFTVEDCLGRKVYDNQTFYVSDTPPGFNKIVGTPHCGPEWEDVGKIPRAYWDFFPDGAESYCVNLSTLITLEIIPEESCCVSDGIIEYKTWLATDDEPDEWTTYTEPFNFEEECKHYLLVRAYDCLENGKENISYWDLQIFYVDELGPSIIKEVGDPKVYLGLDDHNNDQWLVYPYTDINLSIDPEFPGDGCCPNETGTIEYRYWYLGEWTDWMIYTGSIHLSEGCVHYLEARAIDCLGNKGEVDNETFWVCGPGGDSGPSINFIEPGFGETSCEPTLEVIIHAYDDETDKEDLLVYLWIPSGMYGPTQYYPVEYNPDKYGDEYFHAFIDIYKYQDGTPLSIKAVVIDEDMNADDTIELPFHVCSTTVFDQWMRKGWNQLILPPGVISCSNEVEHVLASVYDYVDGVFYFDGSSWSSYIPGEPWNPWTEMQTGKTYWIYITKEDGLRYYTDTHSPTVNITYPNNDDIFEVSSLTIEGNASDVETGIDQVTIRIYDNETGEYWNGSHWTLTETKMLCMGSETWHFDIAASAWTNRLDHKIIATATASDNAGCYDSESVFFTFFEDDINTLLTIDPPNLVGETNTMYNFSLLATNIPTGLSNVTFEWNFGDGTSGSIEKTVVNNQSSTEINHSYTSPSSYGLVAVVKDSSNNILADAYAVITIGEVIEREYVLDECGTWEAADQGGYGLTIDNWDISEMLVGCSFDISFNAYNQPDRYIVEYPIGNVVLDTGWRGSSSYDGNPLYPGGIAGPGIGEEYDIFTKNTEDVFRVTIIGGESGTLWNYKIFSPCNGAI